MNVKDIPFQHLNLCVAHALGYLVLFNEYDGLIVRTAGGVSIAPLDYTSGNEISEVVAACVPFFPTIYSPRQERGRWQVMVRGSECHVACGDTFEEAVCRAFLFGKYGEALPRCLQSLLVSVESGVAQDV